MAQLTGIGIENFRVFKDFTEFEFAPITILTGTNSSGKSSLFKALLLLADNAQRNGLSELDFTGEGHQLGTFETVKTKGSEKEEMTFVLHYKFTAEELLNKYKLTFNNLNELTSEINEGVWFGILRDGYALHYTFKKEKCISYKVVIEKEGESHTIYQEEFFLDKKGKEYKQISKDIDLF
ncbi:MAG: AAA family ATPase, partial [Thermoflexibacteraceae bacterium]